MDNNMVGDNRYKLIHRLEESPDWQAYAALDIENSQREEVLLNIYVGGEAIRRVVQPYYDLSPSLCPDFCRIYTENARFTAVFKLHATDGELSELFSRRSGVDNEERQLYTEKLLHAALENAGMPLPLLSALLRPENVAVQRHNQRICFNAALPPLEGEPVGVSERISVLLETVLRRPWDATDEQIDYMDAVRAGEYETLSALYSAWRELVPVMERERMRKAFLPKFVRYVKRTIKRYVEKKKKERRERKLREDGAA